MREETRQDDLDPEDAPTGADPTIDDDLAAREIELREMTEERGNAPLSQDEIDDEVENPENLVAQAGDPEAQES